MNPSDAITQMTAVGVDHGRINRGLCLPSCFSSRLASAFSAFCIGLLSGAAGGLLLGTTAVVVLESLELLADNRQVMDQLNTYIVDYNLLSEAEHVSQRTSNDRLLNIYICLLLEDFGVFSAAVSLAVGIATGSSTYDLVIKKYGETAEGKALALAGNVCLMCVTVTGYALGLALDGFIIYASSVSIISWYDVSKIFMFVHLFLLIGISFYCKYTFIVLFLTPLNIPVVTFIIFTLLFLLKTKLILMVVLFPAIFCGIIMENKDFTLIIAPVPLMLIITDIFNIARQPIVNLQTPASTNTDSAVVEGIFVGVLITHLLVVAIGMSLFVSFQKGGAAKIGTVAAGSGGAVLAVIKSVTPVLGPGPTIGALMGVAGAVGVSLSAAGAATDKYGHLVDRYGLVGRLGVTAGAALGAFLHPCSHGGLSALFMALCAATIPAGLYLQTQKDDMWWVFKLCLRIITTIYFLILLHFNSTVPSVEFSKFFVIGYICVVQLCMLVLMLDKDRQYFASTYSV